ncbi:hypothetical protein vBEf9_22 [Enterococcus phage vb_GEC_Ef_S_9]|nr:hypothetical protein vBEf9_22 [Enterococcus phage vb_GEC_Ef_S_9]
MILYYKEEGYTSRPIKQVEYKRIENKTYAPKFVIDGNEYGVVNLMESYKTVGEEEHHHMLVADVVLGDTNYFAQYELTIDYDARVIVIKFIKEIKED